MTDQPDNVLTVEGLSSYLKIPKSTIYADFLHTCRLLNVNNC